MPRFHCSVPLTAGASLALPSGAARHVQVLRMQPGDALTLFDGAGGEYAATVERMGRSEVAVVVGSHLSVEREAPRAVHLAVGMPANERMDWLVEKATELGVASIQPLATAHGVLRLSGERAEKKRAHWEAIAVAACEQCGRNRVPVIHPVQSFSGWIDAQATSSVVRLVLSLTEGTHALPTVQVPEGHGALVLSGSEGGLSGTEEQQAIARGFAPVTLGARVLRAETAALAALVSLAGL
jgi:16S rRNA (uracil1498-N3)-methyltransferase